MNMTRDTVPIQQWQQTCLWIQICYLYYTKYIWEYLYHERKVSLGGHQVQHNLLLIMKAPINNKKDDWLSNKGHHANPILAIDFFMDPNMLLSVLHQIHLEIYYIPWKKGFTWWSPSAIKFIIDFESHNSSH
jgi:hypothetical protein